MSFALIPYSLKKTYRQKKPTKQYSTLTIASSFSTAVSILNVFQIFAGRGFVFPPPSSSSSLDFNGSWPPFCITATFSSSTLLLLFLLYLQYHPLLIRNIINKDPSLNTCKYAVMFWHLKINKKRSFVFFNSLGLRSITCNNNNNVIIRTVAVSNW